jgi:hypothetical protein
VQTFVFPLTAILAAGNRSADFSVQFNDTLGATTRLNVEAEATGILIEAKMNCTSPSCRFYSELALKTSTATTAARDTSPSFDGTLRRTYEPPEGVEEGEWILTFRSDAVNANMKGDARVSVFYGSPVPQNFTAYP